MLRYKTEIRPG